MVVDSLWAFTRFIQDAGPSPSLFQVSLTHS